MVIFSTHKEAESIESNLKFRAYSNQTGGDWFQNTMPFKLNGEQLSFCVGLQEALRKQITQGELKKSC